MSRLARLQKHWEELGKTDPLWAVLSAEHARGNRWDEAEFFRTGEADVSSILAEVAAAGISVRFGRALDFGSGVGRLTQALARRFEEVIGVDISHSMVQQATARNAFPESCRYQLNETNDLRQFPTQHFDFILSLMTLQHVPPRHSERYLRELVRVLTPDGAALLQIPARPIRRWSWVRVKTWLRRLLFGALPARLGGLVYREITGRGAPMEMYGLPLAQVIREVEAAGGIVAKVTPDHWAGDDWESQHYFVVKRGQPKRN